VVDEVDYLIETVPKKNPERAWRGSYEKAIKKIRTHPGATRELLDMIFTARKEVNARMQEWAWDEGAEGPYRKGSFFGSRDMPGPQLVVSSATLRTHLSNYLYDESGWMNKSFVMKVKNTDSKPVKKTEETAEERVREGASSGRVKHCIIEVSKTEVRNVEGAIDVTEDGAEQVETHKLLGDLADERPPRNHMIDKG